ncbi:MAG: peptidoglycan DD-metalloendopeptidase family protein [Desulfobulbaceae bacterium]|nr:peptidoglycan DD-metalloendopeptidase family protein [Desulfobulbaceae bacterium]
MSIGFFRTPLALSLAVLAGAIFQPARGWSAPPGLEEIDKPIQQHESNLEKLRGGMQIHLGRLQIVSEQEFNLLDQIERLDKNLALQKIRLDVMIDRLNSQEELLALKERDLRLARQGREKVKSHLEKRLRSYYLMGKTGLLNVTFSTRTLPDLMLFNDSFKTLIDYDKKLFNQYRDAIEQLILARDSHEKESILLSEFITNAVEQQKQLDSLLEEKKELLTKVKTQKILHEQALKELKKAEEELRATLAQLQKKRDYTLKGFVLNKGRMAPPVQGEIVTRFGESREGVAIDTGASQGITFDAPNGAEIRSIFAGRVLFAGYRKGFGNMVIIDHGLDYYSITSRMEKISVQEGQLVGDGEIIGAAGDIATLFEKGVYFEIRHDTKPLDPLAWISIDG